MIINRNLDIIHENLNHMFYLLKIKIFFNLHYETSSLGKFIAEGSIQLCSFVHK